MIRGSGHVGLLKRARLDERANFPTPGTDRVRDGRQLLEQEDDRWSFVADHVGPWRRVVLTADYQRAVRALERA